MVRWTSAFLGSLAATASLSTGSVHAFSIKGSLLGSSVVAEAPLVSSLEANVIPDQYIVVLRDQLHRDAIAEHHDWINQVHDADQAEVRQERELKKRSLGEWEEAGLELTRGLVHTFDFAQEGIMTSFGNGLNGALRGYAGHFSPKVIAEIRRRPEVAYVERDQLVHTQTIQKSAPWGLARISHRDKLSFGTFNKYLYDAEGGEGVTVYVIDTGVYIKHVDLEGRASWGKTIPQGDPDEDGNGHGSHCAGTIASKTYGVAKKAHIKAVKVLRSNGSGTMSDVIKGVEWAAVDAKAQAEAARAKGDKKFKGSVANMSLGGSKSPTLDSAVNAAVADFGLHFAVAAGNDNQDACKYSPAAAENAVTVMASTLGDDLAYFSNWGACTDIAAPGLNINSIWNSGPTSTNIISGTSMASPHIAGLLAYLLSTDAGADSMFSTTSNATMTPKILKKRLLSLATKNVLAIKDNGKSPNLLAFNGNPAYA